MFSCAHRVEKKKFSILKHFSFNKTPKRVHDRASNKYNSGSSSNLASTPSAKSFSHTPMDRSATISRMEKISICREDDATLLAQSSSSASTGLTPSMSVTSLCSAYGDHDDARRMPVKVQLFV